MQPFYFSIAETELFAVYHAPKAPATRQSAVLLCNPIGHEYLNSHRAYRQIAEQLSDAGFPVLRFDYFGCGDSGGPSEQASVDIWLRDISQAASQLRQRSNARRICLAGLRAGATLAMMAAARLDLVDSLVLWDPVVKGPHYMRELAAFHKRVLDAAANSSRKVARPESYDGLSLFGFGSKLGAEFREIDLLSIEKKPAERVLMLESGKAIEAGPLNGHLRRWGSSVEYKHVPVDGSWRRDFDSVLLPGQVIPALVRWTSEVCA